MGIFLFRDRHDKAVALDSESVRSIVGEINYKGEGQEINIVALHDDRIFEAVGVFMDLVNTWGDAKKEGIS